MKLPQMMIHSQFKLNHDLDLPVIGTQLNIVNEIHNNVRQEE